MKMEFSLADKTWKKVLIAALAVLAVAAAVDTGLYVKTRYDIYHGVSYWETQPQHVSPNILMVHGHHGLNHFVRLKDVRTDKFTTPELQHIFINEYSTEDSLVVFRTFGRLRGYLNVNTGKIVIPAQYNRAWNFSEGIAGVLKDGVVSFIKADGTPAFSQTFPIFYYDDYSEIAFQFHHGLCVMRTMDNKWGLINTQGEWAAAPVYTTISAPQYGYRIVSDGRHYGMLTEDGKEALPVEYDFIRRYLHRGFTVAKDGYARVIDSNLQTVIPFVHDGLCTLSCVSGHHDYDEYDEEGDRIAGTPKYWRYDVGEGSGVIDINGNVIIPAVYYMVRMVDENLFEAEVTCGGERILFNKKGECVGKGNV